MKRIFFLLAFVSSLVGCAKIPTEKVQDNKLYFAEEKIDKSVGVEECPLGGAASNPYCQVSYLRLLATPESYSGKLIELIAFYPGEDIKVLLPDAVRWDYGDLSSSLLIKGRLKIMPRDAGYISLRGRFDYDRRDHGVASGGFRQFGVMSEIVEVFPIRAISDRKTECLRKNCEIKYMDGVIPLTVDDKSQ